MKHSTVARALSVLADSWTLLILQRAFLGTRRFAGWRDQLGISESVLAGRLRDMTAACLLEPVPYRDEGGRTRTEYRLTPRALDLWSLLVSIWSWERAWVPREVPLPELWHGGHVGDVVLVCGACGEPVTARDTEARLLAPDLGDVARRHPRRTRGPLPADPLSTFPGAAEVIGDRWGTVLVGCALLGMRTFAEFSRALEVSPDVLSDRLRRFVTLGILTSTPDGYRLTGKGRATFPIIAGFVAWGDRWLGPEGHPQGLEITHRACGAEVDPRLACSVCGEVLDRTAVRFA